MIIKLNDIIKLNIQYIYNNTCILYIYDRLYIYIIY
jgi:hypothetical protein